MPLLRTRERPSPPGTLGCDLRQADQFFSLAQILHVGLQVEGSVPPIAGRRDVWMPLLS